MKTFFIIVSVMVVLFIAAPNSVDAQKKKTTKKTNQSKITASAGKCSVVVRNDLLPNKSVVVVGCDSFGSSEGDESLIPNGGIVVLDVEFNLIFKWTACEACGGFFSRFNGTKKVKGHTALMVETSKGYTIPLYFNGKEFTFADK